MHELGVRFLCCWVGTLGTKSHIALKSVLKKKMLRVLSKS